jgi:hypothetical protein
MAGPIAVPSISQRAILRMLIQCPAEIPRPTPCQQIDVHRRDLLIK